VTEGPITVGLRFERRDATRLAALGGVPGANPVLARRVAEDAAKGEPTIITAANIDEVKQVAASFAVVGVNPPSIEVLSGGEAVMKREDPLGQSVVGKRGALYLPASAEVAAEDARRAEVEPADDGAQRSESDKGEGE
jgi:hypothetical protein